MPASTPIYGITYPCGGDTINPAVLATFANSLDAALAQGRAELSEVTNRPNAQMSGTTSQLVVINTSTDLTFEAEVYDNDGIVNLASSTSALIIQTAGAYFIWGAFRLASGYATLTSVNVILTVNGIERGRKITSDNDDIEFGFTIPMNLDVGDLVRVQARWTGTGGPASVTTRLLTASYIAAP
jgi:hypothetical protein